MKTMMRGAFILTIASFIAKVLSAVYRVPFQNLVGNEGFYVYQQVYPIYGIAMTLALTGLPQFISKIVAEKQSLDEQKKVLRQVFPFVLLLALACWIVCFFGSFPIAEAMGDSQLSSLIQVVSFTFLLMPMLSFYRGNFQGHLLMIPSALSQVIEQFVRVSVILVAAYSYSAVGWSIYETGTIAMGGAVAGGIVAVGILGYYAYKWSETRLNYFKAWSFTKESRNLAKRLLIEGGIVSLYSAFLILFQLVDSFFVKNSLVVSGMSEWLAKNEKGVYDRGQPLVQLGLVIALALSATFLPALTRQFANKEKTRFLHTTKIFLRLTTTIAAAATVGLISLLPYINFTLFKDFNGTDVLSVYVSSIGFMAIIQTYQSIFQSRNQFSRTILAMVTGLFLKIILTGYLTQKFGTLGASASTIIGLLGTLGVLVFSMDKAVNNFVREKQFSLKLVVSLIVMGSVLYVYQTIIGYLFGTQMHRVQTLLVSLIGVGVGGITFGRVIIQLKLFTIREWLSLPFGKKILRIKR